MTIYSSKYYLLLALFLSMWSCDEDLPPSIKINKEIFSVEDQKQLGDVFVNQYSLDHNDIILTTSDYPKIYKYISQFNTFFNTPQVTRMDDFDWDITILNDDTINAFAFPGGHIYITVGLLKFIETESQLVAVIASEIYFCNSDILVNKLVRKYKGVAMGDMFLGSTPEKYTPTEIVEYLTDIKFEEREVILADEMAIDIVCNFRYDVSSMIKIIEKAHGHKDILWMNRQPSDENRVSKINEMIESQDCGEGIINEAPYRKFKTLLP